MGSVFYKMIKDLLALEFQKEFLYILLLHNYSLKRYMEKRKKNVEKVRKSYGHHANGHMANVKNQNVAFFSVTYSNLST